MAMFFYFGKPRSSFEGMFFKIDKCLFSFGGGGFIRSKPKVYITNKKTNK
jgi:hypothetical protein